MSQDPPPPVEESLGQIAEALWNIVEVLREINDRQKAQEKVTE